ncbi:MAG: hypothetical protein QXY52_00550 [Conexivisphaerales archaeon]
MYWIRTLISVISGVVSGYFYVKGVFILPDFVPVIFYLATILLLTNQSYKSTLGTKKLIYHGIGTYIISWLVIYMLSITLISAL